MRRRELQVAVTKVQKAIEESGIRGALVITRTLQSGTADTNVILTAMQNWLVFAKTCGPNERQVIKILGLDRLEENDVWQAIFVRESPQHQIALVEATQGIGFAVNQLPKLLELIRPETVREIEESKSNPDDERFKTPKSLQ